MPHSIIIDNEGKEITLAWVENFFPERMNWTDAIKMCHDLIVSVSLVHNPDNWRLPTRKEVISLIENNMMQQLDAMERGLEFTGFNLSGKLIWTRDSVAEQSNKAYIVDQNGNCSVVNKEELRDVIAVTICSH